MKRFRIPAAFLLILAASLLVWSYTQKSEPDSRSEQPTTGESITASQSESDSQVASNGDSTPAAPEPEEEAAAPGSVPSSSTPSRPANLTEGSYFAKIQDVIDQSELLEWEEEPTGKDETFTRRSLYRSEAKYPLLLLEEEIRREPSGEEFFLSRNLFSGDHVIVSLERTGGVDSRAALEGWLNASGYSLRLAFEKRESFLIANPEVGLDGVATIIRSFNAWFGSKGSAERDGLVFPTLTPNDPDYDQLWGMEKIGAESAWNVATGSAEVIVGIIDTGIEWYHPDLVANMWTNPGEIPNDGIDNDENGFIDDVYGYDFYDEDGDPDDTDGHGTHVAGTVGAVGNNDLGVVGVNWTVRLMALRFLGDFGGFTSDAVRALDYANSFEADLTNNSYGGGAPVFAFLDAIRKANDLGSLFVAAAGNDGTNNDNIAQYPANYDAANVISVAATDETDTLASFSNFGKSTVDIAAPGVGIVSTDISGGYSSKNGTSMAAPHVAGALALTKMVYPGMSVPALKSLLFGSADPVPGLIDKVASGARLNVANMLGAGGGGGGGGEIDWNLPAGSSLAINFVGWNDNWSPATPNNNGNGEFDAGETLNLEFSYQNVSGGKVEAIWSDIEATPLENDGVETGFYSGNWGNLSLGNLQPGQTVTDSNLRLFCYRQTQVPFSDNFRVRVQYTVPEDDTKVRKVQSFVFPMTVENGPNRPNPIPVPPAPLPSLSLSNLKFSDSWTPRTPNNNGNGVFDPGETLVLSYTITNSSDDHPALVVQSRLTATPIKNDDGVDIGFRPLTANNMALGPIRKNSSKTDSNLTVFCYFFTPIGYSADITITVAAATPYEGSFVVTSADISKTLVVGDSLAALNAPAPTAASTAFPVAAFQNWLSSRGFESAQAMSVGQSDLDGNGKAEIVDFVLSKDANGRLVTVNRSGGSLEVSYIIRDDVPLKTVSLWGSSDLAEWSHLKTPAAGNQTVVSNGDGTRTVTVQLTGVAEEVRFFRLRVAPPVVLFGTQ